MSEPGRHLLGRVDIGWDLHHRFCSEDHVFCVATISSDTVHGSIIAHLELSTLALLADSIMSTVPWSADSILNLPSFLALTDSDNITNYFVARDDWKLRAG